jgi:pyruvate/2-oxoglutarate dehydrogenase complex dihydrolipoamide acyltransferase (E2) component
MSINILMPALSPTMTEGKLAKWHVKVGDTVKAGQVMCEIETDKATMEVEAVDEGKIGQIVVPEGAEGVPVNAVIAILLEEGRPPCRPAHPAPLQRETRCAAAPPGPRPAPAAPAPVAPAAPAATAPRAAVFASPLAKRRRGGSIFHVLRAAGRTAASSRRTSSGQAGCYPWRRLPRGATCLSPAIFGAGRYPRSHTSSER